MCDKVSITSGNSTLQCQHSHWAQPCWDTHGDKPGHWGCFTSPPPVPEVSVSVTSISCQKTSKHICPAFRTSSLHLSLLFHQIIYSLMYFPLWLCCYQRLPEQAAPFVPFVWVQSGVPALGLQPCRSCRDGAFLQHTMHTEHASDSSGHTAELPRAAEFLCQPAGSCLSLPAGHC